MKPILQLKQITKNFGNIEVLKSFDIDIYPGEFITLLGPSGCGKTTTLRIIAGLEQPDSGQVILNDKDITNLAPNKRDIHTVFQNYALFPHMNVEDNIGYSLKLKRYPKAQQKSAIHDVLDLVQLAGYEKRMPNELSGGQKQRVAIARALINQPNVLLLDEPLGALDLKLRRQMQNELKTLQKQLGITFIYITHDQEEALNMSTRIAVMKDGKIEQIGTPDEIYNRPKTSYVAQFIGEANILKGVVTKKEDNTLSILIQNHSMKISSLNYPIKENDTITFTVRSESIQFLQTSTSNCLPAKIISKNFLGGMLRITLELHDGTTIIASQYGFNFKYSIHDNVYITWNQEHAIPIDMENHHE